MAALILISAAMLFIQEPVQSYPLVSTDGLRLHNVVAKAMVWQGRRGVRVAGTESAQRQSRGLSAEKRVNVPRFAVISGSEFTEGVIEAEVAGARVGRLAPGEDSGVGIALRMGGDTCRYQLVILHPTVNLRPNEWTRIRVEVRGDSARLFVNNDPRRVRVSRNIRSGFTGGGAVALWVGTGTTGYFRNLVITRADQSKPVGHSAMANGRPRRSEGAVFERRDTQESLSQLLEACWRAEEPGKNRNTSLEQRTGEFAAEVLTRWCRATIDARGQLERRSSGHVFTRIDELTLRLHTDTLEVELRERSSHPPILIVNGRPAAVTWWTPETRERVLRLAEFPLP